MSVKAVAYIRDFSFNTSTAKMQANVGIFTGTGHHDYVTVTDEFELGDSAFVLNSAIRAFVKNYAASGMGVSFGLLDSVQLLNVVDLA